MELSTFIEQKEEAFDEKYAHPLVVSWGSEECVCARVDECECPKLVKSFLTQAIKESYVLALERAIEVAEGMKREVTDCQHTPSDSCDSSCASQYRDMTINESIPYFVTVLQKELSSIRDNS